MTLFSVCSGTEVFLRLMKTSCGRSFLHLLLLCILCSSAAVLMQYTVYDKLIKKYCGALHEEFGERDAARRSLSEAIDVDPANSRAWAAMARLRESDGDYAQALQNYRQAYALNAYQPGVADRIAQLQVQMAQQVPANGTAPLMVETPRGWTQR